MSLGSRLKNTWIAWRSKEQDQARGDETFNTFSYGSPVSYFGNMLTPRVGNERSILASILVRMAIDVAQVRLVHAIVDENGYFVSEVKSELNECLNLEANLDQGGMAFRMDMAMTLFDEGVIALVPVETTNDPLITGAYDIIDIRVAKIVQFYPQHVRVELYNESTGQREQITLPKTVVAIVENPLYAVMNEPNSTLRRLTRKLSILDAIDEQSGSGRLDLIIQLPYVVKSEARKQQAEARRLEIERQLSGSKYGIAYADGTEKITQLNRAVENNLLTQVEYLETLLYSQLGLTAGVINGTASEGEMINYYNRTIAPILKAISEALTRRFITRTARTQGQRVVFIRDPFVLADVSTIADMADKFTRNEILSSNELRAIVGRAPSKDPSADELRNKNMPKVDDEPASTDETPVSSQPEENKEDSQNGSYGS